MRKMSLLTRKFIDDNIKNNTASSSYPQRIIKPAATPENNTSTNEVLEKRSQTSNYYSCFNAKGKLFS
jgi:hypothetical protein